MNDYKWYYSNYDVQYFFLKYLYNREFCILPAKIQNANKFCYRNLRVHNIQSFQFLMRRLGLFMGNSISNFYYSCARFRYGVPYQDLSSLKRNNEEWNEAAQSSIIEYDMLIDIDAGNFSELKYAVKSAVSISGYFDRIRVPYYLRLSGCGFHFIIPYNCFSGLGLGLISGDKSLYSLMFEIAQYLHDNFSEMIDVNIYDTRRVMKLPNSISIYDDKCVVCSPLRNWELHDFDMEKYIYKGKKVALRYEYLKNSDGNIYGLLHDLSMI